MFLVIGLVTLAAGGYVFYRFVSPSYLLASGLFSSLDGKQEDVYSRERA
jgi:hypothetical protein